MYQLPQLSKIEGVLHGVSTRKYGNQAFSILGVPQPAKEVIENRKRFLKELSVNIENGVSMHVGVSDNPEIVRIDQSFSGRGMISPENSIKAEALITNIIGLFLFLVTADCHPIIFFDPVTRSLGLAHGSRQMTDEKLVTLVVERMKQEFGVSPSDLYIGIGPGIKKESYQLEYLDPVFHILQGMEQFTKKNNDGSFNLDLAGINHNLLVEAGIKPENIEVSSIDTRKSSDYFSHYRDSREEQPEGRFATVAILTE